MIIGALHARFVTVTIGCCVGRLPPSAVLPGHESHGFQDGIQLRFTEHLKIVSKRLQSWRPDRKTRVAGPPPVSGEREGRGKTVIGLLAFGRRIATGTRLERRWLRLRARGGFGRPPFLGRAVVRVSRQPGPRSPGYVVREFYDGHV